MSEIMITNTIAIVTVSTVLSTNSTLSDAVEVIVGTRPPRYEKFRYRNEAIKETTTATFTWEGKPVTAEIGVRVLGSRRVEEKESSSWVPVETNFVFGIFAESGWVTNGYPVLGKTNSYATNVIMNYWVR